MSERLRNPRTLAWAAAWVVAIALPFYLEAFWMQSGLFAMAAMIGAIGLTILTGTTGQLSLAHAFFLAVGAYGYCYFAGGDGIGVNAPSGLGLPPLLAMILAVLLAGVCGALFSPIAGRLSGIYLGIASIGLVFIGQQILFDASGLTGGFNGRDAEPFSLAGFTFTEDDPELTVLGVQFTELEKLWYLFLALAAGAYLFARNVVGSRPGRALQTVRDSEIAASVMGVDVRRYKAAAFTMSSMYAGLAGVLIALIFQRIVPETFGFVLSVDYLVMIVIGGLGSISGAVLGALFVTMLPRVLDHYAESLPLLATPGAEGGLEPADAARYLYGAAIVAILIFAPGGLGALGRRLRPASSWTSRGLVRRPSTTTKETP